MNQIKNKQGFLLIEELVSLMIFVVVMSLLMTCFLLVRHITEELEVPDHLEWHLCLQQLNYETEHYQLKKFLDNPVYASERPKENWIYLKQKKQQRSGRVFYISKNSGYHPILIGFERLKMTKVNDKTIHLSVVMPHKKTFDVDFVPASRTYTVTKQVKKNEQ